MMTETEKLDQALTEADARKWRYKAEQAEAALTRSEAHLKLMQSEMNKIASNLGGEIELLARAEQAEAALAAMQTPCVWRVKAPAHFVGHMDDKPLEMILVATSCGKELGVQLPPPYCAYCGHPVEVQP